MENSFNLGLYIRRAMALVAVLLLGGSQPLGAQDITTDTVWTAAASPHRPTAWVTVTSGATLTIEPGAVVEFPPLGTSLQGTIAVQAGGRLVAVGTAPAPIRFSDGRAVPGPGGWSGIVVDAGGSASLEHCVIEHTGQFGRGALAMNTSDVTVRNVVIRDGAARGIRVGGVASRPVIEATQVIACVEQAISIEHPTASPLLSGLAASNCGFNGVMVIGGDATGPVVFQRCGVPYGISGWLRFLDGGTLDIEPGVEVRFLPVGTSLQSELHMLGGSTLTALGTAELPIIFTDGRATPGPGGWPDIILDAGSTGTMEHCVVEYAGQFGRSALTINTSDATIRNVTIRDCAVDGVLVTGVAVTPLLEDVAITGCAVAAIRIAQTAASPVLRRITATGNGFDGAMYVGGESTGSVTFHDAGVPYGISGWARFISGGSLTIQPGVEVQFLPAGTSLQSELHMQNGATLAAVGTAVDPIVFTDGRATPGPGGWADIILDAGSTSMMQHCVVEYGGQFGRGALTINTSDATIRNVTIRDCANEGIQVAAAGARPLIEDVEITGCAVAAIRVAHTAASPVLRRITATGNAFDGAMYVGGDGTGEVIFHDAGVPYGISGWARFMTGGSLTIEPGAVVQFLPVGTSLQSEVHVQSGGSLTAVGTAEQPILFTDGRATPGPGGWADIILDTGSTATMEHCVVEHAGQFGRAAMTINTSDATIRNVVLRDCAMEGIRFGGEGSRPVIEDVAVMNCGQAAFRLDHPLAAPQLARLTATGNLYNVVLYPGADTGGAVTFLNAGVPYGIAGWARFLEGGSLTVQPGVTVRFLPVGTSLQSELHMLSGSTLTSVGTSELPIVYTDGRAEPGAGGWADIILDAGSTATMEHCVVEYGGQFGRGPVTINTSDAVLRHVEVRHSANEGVRVGAAVMPVLEDLVITECAGAAIRIAHPGGSPVLARITASGNLFDGAMYVAGDVASAVTFRDAGVPYGISGWARFIAGGSLTIVPGVEVRFLPVGTSLQSNVLLAEGSFLAASGTAERPIIFTDGRPTPGTHGWAYLSFQPGSRATLEHCVVEFATVGVQADSPDVVVRNVVVRQCANGIQVGATGAGAVFENVELRDNLERAVRQSSIATAVVYRNLSASGNTWNGIAIGGGALADEVTWPSVGVPYILEGGASIESGGALHLETGANVWFPAGYNFTVRSGGALTAQGTPFDPVVISDRRELATMARWTQITFEPGSSGSLAFCDVLGGQSGLRIRTSDVSITNCRIEDQSVTAVTVLDNALPTFRYNRLEATPLGVRNITPATVIDARLCWWGDPSGPMHATLNPEGRGVAVSDGVSFEPWATSPAETVGREPVELIAGEVIEGELTPPGLTDYVVRVRDGNWRNILARLTPLSGAAQWQLVARRGAPPTMTQHDWPSAPAGANRELLIPDPTDGDYYIAVYYSGQPAGPGTYRLQVLDVARHVTHADLSRGGNAGRVTQTVHGAGFEAGTRLELRTGAGGVLRQFTADTITSSRLVVTMDLTGLAPQSARLAVVWPDNGTITLTNPFEVQQGVGGVLWARLVSASFIRPNRAATMWIEYGNEGDADVAAPLLIVRNHDGVPVQLSLADPPGNGDVQVLGINPAGPAGVLPPGAEHRVPVHFVGDAANSVRFSLQVATLDGRAINWEPAREDLRPSFITPAEWDAGWNSVKQALGATGLQYHARLSAVADRMLARPDIAHDVNALHRHIILDTLDAHPVAVAAGVVERGTTGAPVQAATVLAISQDGARYITTVSDRDGRFVLPAMPDGVYTLHVEDYLVQPASIAMIVDQQDHLGLLLHALPPPPAEVAPDATLPGSQPAAVASPDGATLLAWLDGGELRTALWRNNDWRGPTTLATAGGTQPTLAHGANLRGAGMPGYLAAWEAIDEEDRRVLRWAVGEPTDAGVVWTAPMTLTTDHAADLLPAVVAPPNGDPVIVWLQRDLTISDDTDLYSAVLNPGKAPAAAEAVATRAAEIAAAPKADDCYTFTLGAGTAIPFVMQPIFGKSYEFSMAGSSCENVASCSKATQSIGANITIALGDVMSVIGTGTGTTEFALRKEPCRYVFAKTAIAITGAIKGELDRPIPVLLGPIPVGTFYPNVHFGGAATGTLEWDGSAGARPTGGSITFAPTGGGGGAFFAGGTKQTNGLVAGSANVDVSGTFSWRPGVGLGFDGFCLTVLGEGQFLWGLGRRTIKGTWGAGCGKEWGPDEQLVVTDSSIIRRWSSRIDGMIYNIEVEDVLAPMVGTTNIYEGTPLLATVATDTRDDGPASLAVSAAGEVIAAWRKNATTGIGATIQVATFDGAAWSAPEMITPDVNLTLEPVVQFDQNGDAIAVWPQSVPPASGNPTLSDLLAAAATNELWWARRRAGVWSAPEALTAITGNNEHLTATTSARGVLVAWVHTSSETSDVYTMLWNGGAWSAPTIVSRAGLAAEPTVAPHGSGFISVWSEDDDGDANTAGDSVLRHATSGDGLAWNFPTSLPTAFFGMEPGAATPAPESDMAPIAKLLNPRRPRVPDGCCGPECPPRCPPDDIPEPPEPHDELDEVDITIVRPRDPNEKVGPAGWSPSRVVPNDALLTYTIYFENVATADVPAQEVFVTDDLDAQLDWTTLRIAAIGWGSTTVPLDGPTPAVDQRVLIADHREDSTATWWVDVTTNLDDQGRLRCQFRTLDPETGDLPEDPFAGFLPPNNDAGRGEGFVTFTIRLKPTTPNDLTFRLRNRARIVFDTENVIETDEFANLIGDPAAARQGVLSVILGVAPSNGNRTPYDLNLDGAVDPADIGPPLPTE